MLEQAAGKLFLKAQFVEFYCAHRRDEDEAGDGAVAVAEVLHRLGEPDLLDWRVAVEELVLAERAAAGRMRSDRRRVDAALDAFREVFEKLADRFAGHLAEAKEAAASALPTPFDRGSYHLGVIAERANWTTVHTDLIRAAIIAVSGLGRIATTAQITEAVNKQLVADGLPGGLPPGVITDVLRGMPLANEITAGRWAVRDSVRG